MSAEQPIYRSIVVKVGTNVITNARGELDLEILRSLTTQIAELKKAAQMYSWSLQEQLVPAGRSSRFPLVSTGSATPGVVIYRPDKADQYLC